MNFLANKKRNTSAASSYYEVDLESVPESLQDVLDDKELRNVFRQFLLARVAIESLLFYESIELYENISKDTWRQKAGESIVARFVREDSQYWVNIPAGLREKLSALKEFGQDTFKEAKKEVYNLLNMNFFEKFIKRLQGEEDESAPKLSFDSRMNGISYSKSLSFEKLSESLGDLDDKNNASTPSCPIRGSKAAANQPYKKEKRRPSKSQLVRGTGATASSQLSTTSSAPPNTRQVRQSGVRNSASEGGSTRDLRASKGGKINRLTSLKLFQIRRVSKARNFTIWDEIEQDEGFEQVQAKDKV